MTPSTTFQWPPSPSGIFQPVKSLPLNRDVNPAGTAPCASGRAAGIARTSASAAADTQAVAFIRPLLWNGAACTCETDDRAGAHHAWRTSVEPGVRKSGRRRRWRILSDVASFRKAARAGTCQIPSSKLQIPTTPNDQLPKPTPNSQFSQFQVRRALGFGGWEWLELGAWDWDLTWAAWDVSSSARRSRSPMCERLRPHHRRRGPGGSNAAAVALDAGLRVVQIDSARFPRVKPCAGGVTLKAAGALRLRARSFRVPILRRHRVQSVGKAHETGSPIRASCFTPSAGRNSTTASSSENLSRRNFTFMDGRRVTGVEYRRPLHREDRCRTR